MDKIVYTVATSHLDTVWNWDFETTCSQYIYNTLVDNFKYFNKYPDYKFNFEGAYRYELIEEYYPQLFEEMKKYISDGKWNVCGSAYENGDVNIPSPEALFRNILLGNGYFKKKFGKTSVDIFLPDCFGFGYALPSIMHHAHLLGFTTQNLTWGSAYGIPFDIGVWKGVDGNSVFASTNPGSYSRPFKKIRDWDFILEKLELEKKYGFNFTYVFHGTGDRGGAVKEESCKVLEKEISKNKSSSIKIVSDTADGIYHRLAGMPAEEKSKLPVWDNELVMNNHGAGSYTSRAIGKRWNRRCEELADVAERTSVISNYFGLNKYNRDAINTAWKEFIAHQFHDDITGTSCQRVYKRSWNDYACAMNKLTGEIDASGSALTNIMDTSFCEGTPVAVFNQVEKARRENVKVRLKNFGGKFARVFDSDGNETFAQITLKNEKFTEILFTADVPSYGYKVYDVRPSDKEGIKNENLKYSDTSSDKSLENEKYTVTFNSNGDICSIFDKELSQELLLEPVVLGLFKYTGSKNWPAWEMNYEEANKEPDKIPKLKSIELTEKGSARIAFKITQEDGESEFTDTVALSEGGKGVEVYSEIEWRNTQTLAKRKFKFLAGNDNATFDLGLGAIERGRMNDKLFEVPAQKWVDLTDKTKNYGVSVISECKYGWDKYDYHTLRLTVLHTPQRNYRIDSMQSMMDLGLNRYSFAIMSHSGKTGEETQTYAREFVTPMCTFVSEKHKGMLGTEYSFMSVSDNDVIVRAVKLKEDSDEIIVRLNEGGKKRVSGFTLSIGNGIESAREMWADETYKARAKVENGKLVTNFEPYEIRTFALKLKPVNSKSGKIESAPLSLPYNIKFITNRGEKSEFEYTAAANVIPETVVKNGAVFKIAKDSGLDAVSCRGQNVKLPKNTEKAVLLLGSTTRKKELPIGEIPSIFERFAGWDLYDFKETAYINDGYIGFEINHCHDKDGQDVFCKKMTFYIIEINTEGKDSITLPFDEDIVVLAASTLNGKKAELSSRMYDEVENHRKFTFEMTPQQKKDYILYRQIGYIGDKDRYFETMNYGKDY